MRRCAAVLLTIGALAADTLAFEAGARGAAGPPAAGACAILTKELLSAHTPASPESFKLMTMGKPMEEKAGIFAELLVTSGARVVTIQMSVPNGRTPQEIQPNTISLAKAILAKLR